MKREESLLSLVDRIKRREPDAWEQVYRQTYARLFHYARRRLGSDAAADDAVSETMARALQAIDTFTWQGAGLNGWLYGIVRNVVFEQWARREHPHADVGDERESPELAADERLVADEQRRFIRTAFSRLSPEDQEVLELRVMGDLSADEVAQVMGKRPGAVRMAQSRALQRLRQAMEAVTRGD